MIRGVHHLAIHVRDMEKMIAFYREGFGFDVVGEPFAWEQGTDAIDNIIGVKGSAAKGAMLRAGNFYVEMFEFSAPAPAVHKPLDPNDKGYTHMCIDVTNIEEEYARLKRLGMTFADRAPVDMGHVKSVYGRDPEGNLIELQETQASCDFPLKHPQEMR